MSKKSSYQVMLEESVKDGSLIRPIHQSGSGRYAKYSSDMTDKYCKYLDKLGVKYEIGNDSPRGGQLGKFIRVIK